ncbi:hypothetical protein HER21_28685 [Pseudomonas sp. BGM005]|nr:hypothetical protein [Pseudomonas sp. BG5]
MTEPTPTEPNYDDHDWFLMGAEAFRAGQPLDLCPSPVDNLSAAVNWDSGWHEAMNEALTEGGY